MFHIKHYASLKFDNIHLLKKNANNDYNLEAFRIARQQFAKIVIEVSFLNVWGYIKVDFFTNPRISR